MKSLLKRSLRYYWRTNLGVVLGSALATLVLTGALMVGDSVKATLKQQAEARVGKINSAFLSGERLVNYPKDPEKRLPIVALTFVSYDDPAPVLMLQGVGARLDYKSRANSVQILGVNVTFWSFSPSGEVISLQDNEVALNETLATQLDVTKGEEILVRVEKPGAFSRDAPLSGTTDSLTTIRLRVVRIVSDANFGRFALQTTQTPPNTAFVSLSFLQEKLGLGEKVNLLLDKVPDPVDPKELKNLVSKLTLWDQFRQALGLAHFEVLLMPMRMPNLKGETLAQMQFGPDPFGKFLPDFDLEVKELPNNTGIELRTSRIFLADSLVLSARANEQNKPSKLLEHISNPNDFPNHLSYPHPSPGLDSLTYFVNGLSSGDKATPYSMVTALDATLAGFVPADLKDDEMVISQWLAEDLGVKEGAYVTLKYFVMGERRQLLVQERTFSIRAVLPMTEPQLNTSWMPDFPGMSDKDSCRDWEPGFDFDAKKIRDKDEEYWKQHRGTPKAFITLKSGQEMWGNRWGKVTSIRYPAGTAKEQIERIGAFIDPAALGFKVIPLREQAFAATKAPVDFGQLFISFSFFLIIAAAVLTGLLFTFSVEQRSAQAGLLLAVGWRPKQVRRLFIREGLVLALIGSVIGVGLAAVYTKLVLHGLATIWSGAASGTRFIFAPDDATYFIGIFAGIFIAWLAMRLASRRLFARHAAALLSGDGERMRLACSFWRPRRKLLKPNAEHHSGKMEAEPCDLEVSGEAAGNCTRVACAPHAKASPSGTPAAFVDGFWLLAIILLVSLSLFLPVLKDNPAAFFGLGFLLLATGILFCRRQLRRLEATTDTLNSLESLALRNTSRRRGRSLATIAVLASGVFMVVAVDSFRKTGSQDYTKHDSGTGGFALIGESASPIYEDLNTAKGRDEYALDDKIMADVRVVPFRVRDGDDASCLNLNRAMQPRLLGVKAADMNQRFRFSKATDWNALEQTQPDGSIPGIVDANTLQWALQKKLGETLDYQDERGQIIKVRLVAAVPGSILQGVVVISEDRFIQSFPNEAGYRFFLVDCPADKLTQAREHLSRQLQDRGLELTPAAQRLAEFNAVENTYLSIFQVLGGLGILLGSAGLGIVVMRNVLERRSEFALLEAVGFTRARLRRLVFIEHRWLIIGALAIGTLSALIAVWPNISQRTAAFPWLWISLLIAGMTCLSVLWAWLATHLALRNSQLAALRNE